MNPQQVDQPERVENQGVPDGHRQSLYAEVGRHCPQVASEVLDDFFEQLDDDYFALFTAAQVADHVQLVAAIDDQHPLRVRVTPRGTASAEILVVGYDLVGAFALITGAMAACGLNIREGQVFSYKRGPERLTPWGGHTRGGLIVDLFTVDYDPDQPFDADAQETFAAYLTTLIQLQRQGKQQQARDTLNYRLIDAIRTSGQSFPGRLFPVEVRIDNTASPDWTVVHVTAEDTPGFLYSLSNALAMRDFYVHRVSIRSVQGKVQDELCLGRRQGGKITSDAGQQELRFIVVLIKQFTHFLTSAPDPAMALQHFDQFLERLAANTPLGANLDWLREDDTLQALATMLGSSNFLWEDFLRMQHANLLPVLREMHATDRPVDAATLRQRLREGLQAADTPAARKAALNTFKDREMFRIDLRHLLRPDLPFGVFADELTDLAEVVVAGALEVAQTDLGERYGRAAAGRRRTLPGRPVCARQVRRPRIGLRLGHRNAVRVRRQWRHRRTAAPGQHRVRHASGAAPAGPDRGAPVGHLRDRPAAASARRPGSAGRQLGGLQGVLQHRRAGRGLRAAGARQIALGGGRCRSGTAGRGVAGWLRVQRSAV